MPTGYIPLLDSPPHTLMCLRKALQGINYTESEKRQVHTDSECLLSAQPLQFPYSQGLGILSIGAQKPTITAQHKPRRPKRSSPSSVTGFGKRRVAGKEERGHLELNQGPLDLQSNALPLSYTPWVNTHGRSNKKLHT